LMLQKQSFIVIENKDRKHLLTVAIFMFYR